MNSSTVELAPAAKRILAGHPSGSDESDRRGCLSDRDDRWPWPRLAWLPLAGLLLFVGGIYANSLRVPFLLDDRLTLVMEPTTHSWSNAARSAYGRRVGMLSFAANYAWGRTDVLSYHVVNLAIHLAAGTLLWALSRRLLRAPGTPATLSRAAEPLAWTIAAIWLSHPLQTNAVTYTVQRFESLASLGILVALYAVARAAGATESAAAVALAPETTTSEETASLKTAAQDSTSKETSKETVAKAGASGSTAKSHRQVNGYGVLGWGGLAILSGWLATQTKEIAIGVPVLALALDRAFFAPTWGALGRRRWWMHAGLAVVAGLLLYESRSAFAAGPASSAGFSTQGLTPWMYLRSQPAVLVHYLRLCFWPDPLCLDYGWPVSVSPASIYGWGAVIVGLLAATAYALYRTPRLGFLGVAFFTVLAPTSSFVPIADLAFEHRMYLPLAPVAALAVLAGHSVMERFRRRTVADQPAGSASIITADAERIFARRAMLVSMALAVAMVGGLGYRTLTRNGELSDPELLWRQCIAVNPTHVRPRVNYIGRLIAKGDIDGAIRECQEALRLGSNKAELHSQMGVAYLKKGMETDAERCFRAATEADPNFPMSWFNWASLHFKQSRHAEACQLYRRSLAVHPQHVESWSGLGWSLELLGETREAATCYRRALQIDPSLVVVSTRLADLLATARDASIRSPAEALRIVEPLARRTKGRNPYILDTWAAALAANGKRGDAVRIAEAAMKLTRDNALRSRLETRLAAYRNGEPIQGAQPVIPPGPEDAVDATPNAAPEARGH